MTISLHVSDKGQRVNIQSTAEGVEIVATLNLGISDGERKFSSPLGNATTAVSVVIFLCEGRLQIGVLSGQVILGDLKRIAMPRLYVVPEPNAHGQIALRVVASEPMRSDCIGGLQEVLAQLPADIIMPG